MARIYADYAATTPARPEVVAAMLPYFSEGGYNASSLHAEGRAARSVLDRAREEIARLLGARAKEIVFTAGGSEADNLAIFGVAKALRGRGRHIVTAATEHHAVVHAAAALAEDGYDVTYLPLDSRGRIEPAAFEVALRPDTVLATVMLANNETGVIQPVAELAKIARERGVLFHTDAVQAPATVELGVDLLGVDLLSISAHKFYGPKGVGALYIRDGTPLAPIVVGGSQEFAKRAGTENVAGIAGMSRALSLAVSERTEFAARMDGLRAAFERELSERLDDLLVVGSGAERLSTISNIAFAGVAADALVMRLDLEGVAISTGSACASGSLEPSHVIAALNLDSRWQRSAVRFSFGRGNGESQIGQLAEIVSRVVTELRSFSARSTH